MITLEFNPWLVMFIITFIGYAVLLIQITRIRIKQSSEEFKYFQDFISEYVSKNYPVAIRGKKLYELEGQVTMHHYRLLHLAELIENLNKKDMGGAK